MNFSINVMKNGEKTTLVLSGRLDTTTSPKLEETLITELSHAKCVELDFVDLVYVTSAGLRVLLLGEKTAKAQGSKQIIMNVSPEIMEIFDMTGFSSILSFS